jgi:hypothetical protein
MKKSLFSTIVFSVILLLICIPAEIRASISEKNQVADCQPPSSFAFLDISKVRARVISGGDMWWDFSGDPYYEVPKGSRKHSMFAGALWIGGVDDFGQLRLAALRYRQNGNDYWPGPLTIDGDAEIDWQTCHEYDRIFTIYKEDVVDFVAWFKNPTAFPGYSIPQYFFTYPAHGDVTKGQARYLAPFYDHDGDGQYNPLKGDYPYYCLDNSLCCPLYLPSGASRPPSMGSNPMYGNPTEFGGILYDQTLKGDQTLWWVFNDKGNVHTETGGAPIGLEIRAQAFAFKEPQDISYGTFYGYEVINRSNRRINEVYLGIYIDPDVGYAFDDYVGSDVKRGMGYAYNGNMIDGSGLFSHYGANPPAIGIDFFHGPYMDPDGQDNPKYTLVYDSISGDYIPVQICNESINGQNFGNGIIDDERMGMQKFIYIMALGNTPFPLTYPSTPEHYYDFLRGIWKDGTTMMYGGQGHQNHGAYGPECSFMFPGDSDPCLWNTNGLPPNSPTYWTEETAGNVPYDRRFLTSAGPFTLEAGGVNYITWGVPWARASTGGPQASVELLKYVDDRTQRFFDICFRIVDGPDAPDISGRELDREIILYLSNKPNSNNFNEKYEEWDMMILPREGFVFDSIYRFEGYIIYQVLNPHVSLGELHNPDKARIVAQCDVKNNVSRIVNYYYEPEMNANIPVEEVNGSNQGIVHSFRILEDMFATGSDRRLVNNKKYYYTAVAYGFNEYEKFSDDPAYHFSGDISFYGQKRPFVAGRRNRQIYTFIPNIPAPLAGGTIQNSVYGTQPEITRIEGHGNGGLILELTEESVAAILEDNRSEKITYKQNHGPVNVKVIDPLNLKPMSCRLVFIPGSPVLQNYSWQLEATDLNGNTSTYTSNFSIDYYNEQLIPQLGLSVEIDKSHYPGDLKHPALGILYSDIEYEDVTNQWLSWLPDQDWHPHFNWIRSGTTIDPNEVTNNDYDPGEWLDPEKHFQNILGGTWAPYRMASKYENGPAYPTSIVMHANKLDRLFSVDIVFTPDKSKWSRCPVVETGDDHTLAVDNVQKTNIRKAPSVNKDGLPDGDGTGMSWFPGYAINVETGERLNVMFGESSWLAGENGNDMMFNPTSELLTDMGEPLMGGKHFLYIFGSFQSTTSDLSPAYDEGEWARGKLNNTSNFNLAMRELYQSVMWVSIPLSVEGIQWLSSEVKVRIRVTRPYKRYSGEGDTSTVSQPVNNNYPVFEFNTFSLVATTHDHSTSESALQLINVVPNPYYAHGDYSGTMSEQIVKITNLPGECTVSIFNAGGSLVRQFRKNDEITYIEWDLKNEGGGQIAGGMYLIHVNAPGIGERTLKWFGSMRVTSIDGK